MDINLDYRTWLAEDATDSRLEYISILLARSNSTDDIKVLRKLQEEMRVVLNRNHAARIKKGCKHV